MPAGIRAPMSKRNMVRTRTKMNLEDQRAWLKKRGYKMNAKKKWVKATPEKKYKKKSSMKAKTKTKAYHDRKRSGLKSNMRDTPNVKYI